MKGKCHVKYVNNQRLIKDGDEIDAQVFEELLLKCLKRQIYVDFKFKQQIQY